MPNELYVQWLKEWMDKAFELQSKGYQTLKRAHESMVACPFELGHPSQAAQLKFIGPVLCARLEKNLLAHCKAAGQEMPQRPSEKRVGDETAAAAAPQPKKRVQKAYAPTYRSGPYAILMGMTEPSAKDSMPKSDVIRLAQPYCDSSFDVPSDTRGHYTAWNSMKTLLDKELVYKSGSPSKYTITDAGADIAARLRQTANPTVLLQGNNVSLPQHGNSAQISRISLPSTQEEDDDDDASESVDMPPPETVLAHSLPDIHAAFDPIVIKAGTYSIQLVIDNREVRTQKDKTFIDDQLDRAGIQLTSRALDVGDALWIAKCHDGREFVLDHIVERKRMDDLVSSIKDGRYQEQKFRLAKCGARNIIFVIEETNAHEVGAYQEAIQTALSSTQMVNGFFVKRVQSLDYTIRYLVSLNRKLAQFYESQCQDLYVLPDHMVDFRTFSQLLAHLERTDPRRKYYLSYEAFSGLTAKSGNLQVGEVWLRMLMTIRGVSAEKAVEIQSRFPTLQHLLKAYEACTDQGMKDKLMNQTCCGFGRKGVGVALSKKIASLFT